MSVEPHRADLRVARGADERTDGDRVVSAECERHRPLGERPAHLVREPAADVGGFAEELRVPLVRGLRVRVTLLRAGDREVARVDGLDAGARELVGQPGVADR